MKLKGYGNPEDNYLNCTLSLCAALQAITEITLQCQLNFVSSIIEPSKNTNIRNQSIISETLLDPTKSSYYEYSQRQIVNLICHRTGTRSINFHRFHHPTNIIIVCPSNFSVCRAHVQNRVNQSGRLEAWHVNSLGSYTVQRLSKGVDFVIRTTQ